jgi:AcrR family transcriptional regulator
MIAYVHRMQDQSSAKRRYTLKDRARSQEDTRRRIVEAAVALHEELGPRATPISAIAERAGVQRLTVYRHLPDEEALFRACTSHWGAAHPLPGGWAEEAAPAARRARALREFYGYYSANRRMLAVVHHEAPTVPALARPLRENAAAFAAVVAELARGLGPRAAATMGVALGYAAWEALERQGLADAEKAALALAWLEGAAAADRREGAG